MREFIDSLSERSQMKFFFVKSLLEELGRSTPMPHSKYMGDDIFELRFTVLEGKVRILYFFANGSAAIFTNGFIKKSSKTPQGEMGLAVKRKNLYVSDVS